MRRVDDWAVVPVEGSPIEWRTCRVYLQGVRPLLLHDRVKMERLALWSRLNPRQKSPSPEEEAEMGVVRGEDGTILFRTDAIRECMRQASRTVALEKGQTKAKKSTEVLNSVFPVDELVPILRPPKELPVLTAADEALMREIRALIDDSVPVRDYEIDIRRVMVQRNGVPRARARIDAPWLIAVDFLYDYNFYRGTPMLIAMALQLGGQTIGIGDYRIGKKGLFGMFNVVMVQTEVGHAGSGAVTAVSAASGFASTVRDR